VRLNAVSCVKATCLAGGHADSVTLAEEATTATLF
jgi:hypothetical protein